MEEKELKKRLLKENEEFKKNYELHQKCERRLEELNRKNFLSDEEKLEEKELKKKKLALKDRMYYLMIQYKQHLSLDDS